MDRPQFRYVVLASIGLAMVPAACGGDDAADDVACEVDLGDSHSEVTFAAVEGTSIETTVGEYPLSFEVLPDSGLRARLSGALAGFVAEGSVELLEGQSPTPDGNLTFACS